MVVKLYTSLGIKKMMLKIWDGIFNTHMGIKNPDRVKKSGWVLKTQIWYTKLEIGTPKLKGILAFADVGYGGGNESRSTYFSGIGT